MRVLSLFDGLSGGRIALDRLGFDIEVYFASEIDPYAIAVAGYNFQETHHIGSVVDIDTSELGKIDLLVGGSPCQGFSFYGKQKGSSTKEGIDVVTLEQYLELKEQGFEFEGQSYLFWEYMRVLHELREVNPDIKFMLENVVMTQKWQGMFNEAIGMEPVKINSSLVSGQNRQRLYWTNIQVDGQPADKGIFLKDILEDKDNLTFPVKHGPCAMKDTDNKTSECKHVANTTDLNGHDSIKRVYHEDGKAPTLNTMTGGNREPKVLVNDTTYRKLTVLECERLQTVPEGYTNIPFKGKKMSNSQRYKMLGNGWTIDVICHLLKNAEKPSLAPQKVLKVGDILF